MATPSDIVLALENLYSLVDARFIAEGTTLANYFGWREPPINDRPDAGRIVWIPGDTSGAIGEMGPAKYPGIREDGRSLQTLSELFTVQITACDPDDPDNEFRQYRAARLVFDTWLRAVYLSAYGTFRIKSAKWDTTHNQRRRGATIIVVATIEAKIPDDPSTFVDDVEPVVTVQEFDVFEVIDFTDETDIDIPIDGLTDDDGLTVLTEEDGTEPLTDL